MPYKPTSDLCSNRSSSLTLGVGRVRVERVFSPRYSVATLLTSLTGQSKSDKFRRKLAGFLLSLSSVWGICLTFFYNYRKIKRKAKNGVKRK